VKNRTPRKFIVFGLKSIVVIFFTAMLFACENQMETIRELTTSDSIPSEIAKDVRIIFSDSAIVEMVLTSPVMVKVGGKEPYIEFPEGLLVKTYDNYHLVVSELQAEYGKRYERKKLIELYKNFVVINHNTGKKLQTEQLIWNEQTKKIYNSVFVTITEKDKTIHGDSLLSDQSFEQVTIYNVRGTIQIKDEDLD